MPAWLDWLNVDRAAVIVALLGAGTAAWYAHRQVGVAKRQTRIAEAARDAAVEQVAIAKQAQAEAKRSADSSERSAAAAEAATDTARKSLHLETRREHRAVGPNDVELVGYELHRHPRLTHTRDVFMILRNAGSRDYTWQAVVVRENSSRPVMSDTLRAGETAQFQVAREGQEFDGVEVWFNGECPCEQPDGERGHWRRYWPAEEPGDPEGLSSVY